MFQTKTVKAFLTNLKMLAGTTDKGEGVKTALSAMFGGLNAALTAVGIESPKVQSLGGAPNVDPLGETYYSATAFRYGDYIAKVRAGACGSRADGVDRREDRRP